MGKEMDQKILGKLDPSLQPEAAKIQGDKDVQSLLAFGTFGGKGMTTKESRIELRAILLGAVSNGMPLEAAASLKETLSTSPPKLTTDLLAELNGPGASPKAVLEKFMVEAHLGVELTTVVPAKLQDVTVKPHKTVPVSPETAQNLGVARAINSTVKSFIIDGAPNQAPDLLRTGGRNYLMFETGRKGGSVAQTALETKRFERLVDQAKKVDESRNKRNLNFAADETCAGLLGNAHLSAALGTGKCGEHAAMSFTLLTDPSSLSKLGVKLAEGSVVISSLGNVIDHNYVLIAAPGAVTIQDGDSKSFRKVIVNDADNVVVVDPWMPLPCAHTLSRRNDEIVLDPQCKMAMVIKDGKSVLLDNGGAETPLPAPKVPVLDQLNDIKENIAPLVRSETPTKIVPDDLDERLAVAAGTAVSGGKARIYNSTHLSTDTPHDQYQCVSKGKNVGAPESYFYADTKYLSSERDFIVQAKGITFESIAFQKSNLDLMPKSLRERVEIRQEEAQLNAKLSKPKTELDQPKAELEQPKVQTPTQTNKVERINATTHAKPRVRDELPQVVEQTTPKVERINATTRAKPRLRDTHPGLGHTEEQGADKKVGLKTSGVK